jgi:hypothetical protein
MHEAIDLLQDISNENVILVLVALKKYIAQKVKIKVYYHRQSVGQSVLVSGTHLGPATNFLSSLFKYF